VDWVSDERETGEEGCWNTQIIHSLGKEIPRVKEAMNFMAIKKLKLARDITEKVRIRIMCRFAYWVVSVLVVVRLKDGVNRHNQVLEKIHRREPCCS
jgi:hypothetical protein